ncbi:MAG TPA: nucleotidyl transferase AbiEii/AbiGii toxin family protein [Crocinitomicaceae bacterium]|nr:nucleotidyl transferase AbiEii/AbiGii toxin family protein [Crocinitomicaceae bacterium]
MLYYNTVNKLLKETLVLLMKAEIFNDFRLVGETALSLQLGHRESVDIDFFSDVPYGNIDFDAIDLFLKQHFSYVDFPANISTPIGKSYYIGANKESNVKLDIFYTDTFIQPIVLVDEIRLSSVDEIVAMKIDVVQRKGRKKDFWDLHDLLNKYSVEDMLNLHQKRYEYTHDRSLILQNITDFSQADDDFDPICLRGKYWEFIKEDIIEWSKK